MLPGTRDAQVAWGDGSGSWVMTPCFHSRPRPCAVGTARRPAPRPRMGTLGVIPSRVAPLQGESVTPDAGRPGTGGDGGQPARFRYGVALT